MPVFKSCYCMLLFEAESQLEKSVFPEVRSTVKATFRIYKRVALNIVQPEIINISFMNLLCEI